MFVDWYEECYLGSTPPVFDKPSPVLVAATASEEGEEHCGRVWSNRETGSMYVADDHTAQELTELGYAEQPCLSDNTPISAAPFVGILYITDPKNGTFYFDPYENKLFRWVPVATPGVSVSGASAEEMEQAAALEPVPQGNHLLTRYLGRMVLAGEPEHICWMSRAGYPNDWEFGAPPDDLARAVESHASEWGALSGPITALIAFSDDYLLFGQRDSIWRLVGDPLAGGRTVNVTQAIGILGYRAWCITPESELVFMGSEGLFRLAPGGMSFPVPISRDQLPRELLGINPLVYNVVLVYDRVAVGIHIFILHTSGGSRKHWWFDWRNKTFWPVELNVEDVPYDAFWYEGDLETAAAAILGCEDGGLRQFSDSSTAEPGEHFESYCDYGPIRLANVDSKRGVLNTVRLFQKGSTSVNVDVRVGGSAEEAYAASSVYNKLANSQAMRVRRGGSAAYIKLSALNRAWHVENIEVDVAPVGPAKPL